MKLGQKNNSKKNKRPLDFLKKLVISKWATMFTVFLLFLLCVGLILALDYKRKHSNDSYQYGVSFSTKFAKELNLDWQTAYLAIISDLNVKNLRIMSYWDEYQPTKDNYDFSALDWQFNEAQKHGAKISLAIGLRQPRWPECHYPEWAKQLDQAAMEQALLLYLEKVVTRYRNHPALESYQLENEVANGWFGECPDFNRQLLQTELDLVKTLDPEHTVIINVSNQSDLLPLREPIADKMGFSVYNHADGALFGRHWTWSFWYVPASWHGMRASLIEKVHNRPVFIHELQTEPWGPKSIPELTREQQDNLMSPEKLRKHVSYAKKTGIHEIYLWGAEWWYWRTLMYNDYEMWQTAKDIISKNQHSPITNMLLYQRWLKYIRGT